MITKNAVMAKPSKVGHKGFQYPDHEGHSVLVPKETSLTELHWLGGGGWSAWVWDGDEGVRVVWTKIGEDK